MRVALDATPLTVPTGGVTRYLVELRRALEDLYTEDCYQFLSDQTVPLRADWPSHWTTPPPGSFSSKWWLLGLPLTLRRLRMDVFHGTDFSVPYLRTCPSVLSLHDLSPWREAGWHIGADRVRQRTPWLLRLGRATMVLTLSEAIRREAIDRFVLPAERVVAVPLAADARFAPRPRDPSVAPYFLYVGTLEPRKNLPFLVEAWREVWRRHRIPLVLAGRRREDGPVFAEEEGLRLLGAVEESTLPGLYANALAVVYPTLYEGFGLPVLEAMQSGAAVLTSRDPAVTEVAGGAAWQGDARDARAWVEAMCACVENPDRLAEWRAAGLGRAATFSWRRTARETHGVYEEAMRRG
jgi:glycosyltransferase involved in cell wall biosynthesis